MSKYTNYYTGSDVSVYLERPGSGDYANPPQILIDTAASIGWQENLDSAVVYGIGEQRYGFLSSGNVLTTGMLEINFTDDEYMASIFSHLYKQSNALTSQEMVEKFQNANTSTITGGGWTKAVEKYNNSLRIDKKSGIRSFPEGWNLRIVLNNGNFSHDDLDKQFLITGCKIVGHSIETSTSQSGQISQVYRFLARESLSGNI